MFTDGSLDDTPVQLTGTQNGTLLLVEAKVNLITPPTAPSSTANVSGTDKLQALTSTLVLGLLVQLFSNQRYVTCLFFSHFNNLRRQIRDFDRIYFWTCVAFNGKLFFASTLHIDGPCWRAISVLERSMLHELAHS